MNLIARFFRTSAVPGIEPGVALARLGGSDGKGDSRPFLLDVRQSFEYRAGHIAGAKLIPLPELSRRMHELPRDREIICVCRTGHRGQSAAGRLNAAGYQAVNLQGGMTDWARQGLPVKRGNAK